MNAKEWIFKKHPEQKEDWGKTNHGDEFMCKMMEEYAEAKAGQVDAIVIGDKNISDQLFYDIIKEAKESVETFYLCNEIEKKNLKRASIQDIIDMIKKESQ